jgi:hypothetical protein
MAAVKCTAAEISPSAILFLASTGDVDVTPAVRDNLESSY